MANVLSQSIKQVKFPIAGHCSPLGISKTQGWQMWHKNSNANGHKVKQGLRFQNIRESVNFSKENYKISDNLLLETNSDFEVDWKVAISRLEGYKPSQEVTKVPKVAKTSSHMASKRSFMVKLEIAHHLWKWSVFFSASKSTRKADHFQMEQSWTPMCLWKWSYLSGQRLVRRKSDSIGDCKVAIFCWRVRKISRVTKFCGH